MIIRKKKDHVTNKIIDMNCSMYDVARKDCGPCQIIDKEKNGK